MTQSTTKPTAMDEWLSMHEASALIGVSPATLRRWSDAGDVRAFTTPGGHRRFARSAILAMLPSGRRRRPDLQRLGETPERMTRVYRRHRAEVCRGMVWLDELGDDEREPFRESGRRITGSLLRFLDAPSLKARRAAMRDATRAMGACGRIAAGRGVGIRETVEMFLRFRMLFLGELVEVARRRGLDTVEATELLATATKAFDELLSTLMRGHEIAAAVGVRV